MEGVADTYSIVINSQVLGSTRESVMATDWKKVSDWVRRLKDESGLGQAETLSILDFISQQPVTPDKKLELLERTAIFFRGRRLGWDSTK